MAYVYADMDALAEYQHKIIQTFSIVEQQVGCKEDLINETKAKLRTAIERACEVERAAYDSLCKASEMLNQAERTTRECNANLAEGQEPVTTPKFFYENVSECEQEYSYAEARRKYSEQTLESFEKYARSYEEQQVEGIEHIKKILESSGEFFEAYIKKLIEVKACTSVSGASFGNTGTNSGVVAAGGNSCISDPAEMVKATGEGWASSLSSEQYAALNAYTGSAYENINKTLRGLGSSFDSGNKEKAILIHQALSACSIPVDCTVYRGASNQALGSLQNVPDTQLVGAFISDKGFMSTSLNLKDSFIDDIKLVISVPAGAKGSYVGYLSQFGHEESEVLFDIGAVMRITRVDRDNNGKRIIYAQMV